MREPRSLQARLSLAIISVLGGTLCVFSLLLYAAFQRALAREFDQQLMEDARMVANMVEERVERPWQFEPGAEAHLAQRHGGLRFEAHLDDGSVLARAGELRLQPAVGQRAPNAPRFWDATVAGDTRMRALDVWLVPRLDDEAPARPSGRLVRVVVARETQPMHDQLASLRALLVASLLTTLLLSTSAAVLVIRRGLAPIGRVSERADTIDAGRLDVRLPSDDLPRELRPAVLKLNELLARLQAAFVQQSQFTSDASHELRTPLAGLRTILEVAASRERTAAEYRAAIADALGTVEHMHRLVEQLLLLARIEARPVATQSVTVDLAGAVEQEFDALRDATRLRSVTLDNRVPPGATLQSDREQLGLIISNLLRNAVQHADEDSAIVVESALNEGCVLAVINRGPTIPDTALSAIFERFVRLESARSNDRGDHFGIGLSLVHKLCEQLQLKVTACNLDERRVCFTVTRLSSSSHL